ncbi:O-antigen ligase family protein [Alteromonas portus]|uniref:O-antigen ligase family protein n=1 Tax=Alteromonas portus TaxID=2565549 RepID=A0A4U0ZGG6_9ALTE|nr:O-antigen ligase family protein [Alteromonas portus]TKB05208.1 O-antigen ligase family protein [Alteromonas portus]
MSQFLKLPVAKLLYCFLLLYFSYYFSIIDFLTGQGGKNTLEQAASGNLVKQLLGVIVLGTCGICFLYLPRVNVFEFYNRNKLLVCFLAFCILSVFWSVAPFVSFRRFIAFVTLILASYVLVKSFTAESLLNFLLNTIFWITLLGIVYTIVNGKGFSFGFSSRGYGLSGIFLDKNAAARFYGYGIVLQLALSRYRKKNDIFILCTLTLAILLSQSASAFAMTVIGSSLVIGLQLFKGRNPSQSLSRFVIFLFITSIASTVLYFSYEYALSLMGRDPGLTNRTIIWELLLPFSEKRSLLGYGFGAFWASSEAVAFSERWGFIGNAHSGYFEALLNLGQAGLCLKIIFLMNYIAISISNYVRGGKFALFTLSVVIIQAISNYAGFVIFNHNSMDMVIFTLAYFIAINEYHGLRSTIKK